MSLCNAFIGAYLTSNWLKFQFVDVAYKYELKYILQPLRLASFEGEGYLELGLPQGLGQGTAFGFSFKARGSDGVMIASAPPSDGTQV